ncbi:MAG: DUF6320 domain-containing protein [Lachnospiraceae bacterium]|nr:DUF6320 domain-containing protein [Lachnospiraceae bacterium]
MLEFGYSQWRKLDNAALAFPVAAGKNDTRVFRFYCELTERVEPEPLQRALDLTMEKYPLFQAVLRKGLFWFYLERRDIRPLVTEEQKAPCSRLYVPDQKSLLFEVTYHEKRINFEVFHGLTDGTGAMQFLRELVRQYLRLVHPEQSFPETSGEEVASGRDQEEDSFSQYYSATKSKEKKRVVFAVQLRGERLPQDEMRITEAAVPVGELLAKARSRGVSVTMYLTAMLLYAIHEEIPRSRLRRPIALMVPVNLRNYFPSQSMGNFFGWLEVGCYFKEDTGFEEVLERVKEEFERGLSKERVAERMNSLVRLEKNPFLRVVPLEIKQLFLMTGTSLGAKSVTAVYSNMGIVKMAPEYERWISRYGIFASTESLQLCSCSSGDSLTLGFTSKIPNDNIQRNFMQLLKKEGISVTELENDFPGQKEPARKSTRPALAAFSFICVAVSIICCMINYMLAGCLGWAWFVVAGALCAWLLVEVAHKKRRNLLKNVTWQLVLISAIGVLWDVFTGWHGWSVNYLIPIGVLTALGSMPIIALVQHLEKQEYLFYLIQACALGFLPAILMFAGVVSRPVFSTLCTGVSLLVLAGMAIFQGRDVWKEMQKKFRL